MKRKEIVKLLLFPLLLVSAVVSLDLFLFKNVSDDLNSYSNFFKEKEEALDVVLVGNSTVREGFAPTVIWNEFNITSHGFSASPTHPEVIKVAIDEIVNKQHPKVMFIDLNGLTFQRKSDSEFFIKQYYKAIEDTEYKERLENLYPYLKETKDDYELFKNHNNFRQQQYWESLVYPEQFKTKGYYPNNIVYKVNPIEFDKTVVTPLPSDGEAYLNEILEQTDKYKNEMTFIFGKMPRYIATNEDATAYQMFNYIEQRLSQTDYIFKDFTREVEAIGLNPKQDFKDHEHLNHLGTLKFVRYFANYLTNDIHLVKKEKSEDIILDFDEAYEKTKDYLKRIEDNLKRITGQ